MGLKIIGDKKGLKLIRGRRAVFFSMDALIALMIIFLSVLIIPPNIGYPNKDSFVQGDIIKVLSSLKIGEMDNNYVRGLISSGEITDLDNNILEQIGEFYFTDVDIAKNLAGEVLSTLSTTENIGIWYDDVLLASKNKIDFEDAKNIDVERQTISGVSLSEEGVPYDWSIEVQVRIWD